MYHLESCWDVKILSKKIINNIRSPTTSNRGPGKCQGWSYWYYQENHQEENSTIAL